MSVFFKFFITYIEKFHFLFLTCWTIITCLPLCLLSCAIRYQNSFLSEVCDPLRSVFCPLRAFPLPCLWQSPHYSLPSTRPNVLCSPHQWIWCSSCLSIRGLFHLAWLPLPSWHHKWPYLMFLDWMIFLHMYSSIHLHLFASFF